MKNHLYLALLMPLLLFCCTPANKDEDPPADTPSSPNILFFMIDDIGIISTPPYSDTTGNGQDGNAWLSGLTTLPQTPYVTENLQSFSTTALQFNNMYATPSCAPSRSEILTGRYPYRTGIVYPAYCANGPATEADPDGYLAEYEVSFANVCKNVGYETAFGGKWNMRYGIPNGTADTQDCYSDMVAKQDTHLTKMGFNRIYGPNNLIGNTVDYFPPQLSTSPGCGSPDCFFPDSLNSWMQNTATDLISNREQTGQPFLMYYCLGLIHDASSDIPDGPNMLSPSGDNNQIDIFARKIFLADSLIGEILTILDNSPDSIKNNTIVIIAGDNGTECEYATEYNGTPVNGAKLTMNSWGSRVPFMIRWPDAITSTSSPYEGLTDFSDVISTLAEAVNGTDALDKLIDTAQQSDPTYGLNGHSVLYQITDANRGAAPSYVRPAVYCQMQNGAFVANQQYQYRVGQCGACCSPSESGLWDISGGPGNDVFIARDTNELPPNSDTLLSFRNLIHFYDSLDVHFVTPDDGNAHTCGVCSN